MCSPSIHGIASGLAATTHFVIAGENQGWTPSHPHRDTGLLMLIQFLVDSIIIIYCISVVPWLKSCCKSTRALQRQTE